MEFLPLNKNICSSYTSRVMKLLKRSKCYRKTVSLICPAAYLWVPAAPRFCLLSQSQLGLHCLPSCQILNQFYCFLHAIHFYYHHVQLLRVVVSSLLTVHKKKSNYITSNVGFFFFSSYEILPLLVDKMVKMGTLG